MKQKNFNQNQNSDPEYYSLKFYIALQGNKKPFEYIYIGKLIEEMGFDRIYVYDDLMYRPAWPILNLIALHTNKIELGPCLVNGFYCHPAIIAENIVFLDEVAGGRAVLGLGRGAFFDFLNMDNSEYKTRIGCEETIQLVKRFLSKSNIPFKGEYFAATENAILRWDPPRDDIPMILGSWNEKMAFLAGQHCNELQVAGVWNLSFIQQLYIQLLKGAVIGNQGKEPRFSLGGMSCISKDEQLAYQKAKETLAVYLPYFANLIEKNGFNTNGEKFTQLNYYSKRGQYNKASSFVSDDMVKMFSLSGTPEQVLEKLSNVITTLDISGILFSPPYGTANSFEENLQFISEEVVYKLKSKFSSEIKSSSLASTRERINLDQQTPKSMKGGKTMSSTKYEYDAIVIGGGLGGLTCALTLIRKGKKVRLFERINTIGGCQGYYERKGFHFEPNLHSVAEAGEDGLVMKTLGSLGLKKIPTFVKLDPAACFIFPDQKFTLPANLDNYLNLLKKDFPNERAGIENIFKTMNEIYDGLVKHGGNAPIIQQYGGKVFQQLLDEFVSDKQLQAIIAGFWGWGFPPPRVSALLFSTLTYSLCGKGNYLPQGGIGSIIELFEKEILEGGGEISLNSPVKQVLIEKGRAYGVLLESGEQIEAQAIISNADANKTFFKMLGEKYLPTDYVSNLKKLKPALSAFNVMLGIKAEDSFLEGLAGNNMVYAGNDFDSQYEAILNGDLENSPYCITIPTLVTPSLAPAGHHILTLYTPMPYRLEGVSVWKKKKEEFRERFIDLAEKVLPGLQQRIVVIDTSTPDTLVRYTGNTEGAIAGWDFTPQTDMARPQNKTPIEGLYLAGHWTFPGPGTHSAIPSGCITASMIP